MYKIRDYLRDKLTPCYLSPRHIFLAKFPAMYETQKHAWEIFQSNPQQGGTCRHTGRWRMEKMSQRRKQVETKDSFLAENPVSVRQGQIEDCERRKGKRQLSDRWQGYERPAMPCQKVRVLPWGMCTLDNHSECKVENALRKDKTGGKQTAREMLTAILVRGGGCLRSGSGNRN